MQIMWSRFLKSFLLYGVIAVMTMALCSRNSALAASYGRMGRSSFRSSSLRGWSSRSSSGRPFFWSSRISSDVSNSEPSNHPSWSSATTPTCICNCHKEDKNETLTPIPCTDCNCSKEGSQVQNPKKSKAPLIILALAAVLVAIGKFVSGGGGPGSVLMVQVGISDKDRVLQKKLNKIVDSADTSNVDGLNYVLKGVVKALLEHHDSCRFAYFDDKFGSSMKKSVRPSFEELLNREIDRYDKDGNTLLNVDGVKYKKAVTKSDNIANEYSVVTLLVLASDFKLDESLNRSIEHLKSLLQAIETIPKKCIESVEVLWTPQRADETVSEQELRRDFPLMKVV